MGFEAAPHNQNTLFFMEKCMNIYHKFIKPSLLIASAQFKSYFPTKLALKKTDFESSSDLVIAYKGLWTCNCHWFFTFNQIDPQRERHILNGYFLGRVL